jgi:dienelactone hydrolase
MKRFLVCGFLCCRLVSAQSSPQQVRRILEPRLQSPDVTAFQLREYLLTKAPALNPGAGADAWTAEAKRLRRRLLDDVVFHGWPREWMDAPPRFEEQGTLPGNGYRMLKLRYEIVPGFWSTAVLYEPENLRGKAPAILNVNGHVGAPGKAVEYKQKRCINQARQGIVALNLEWFSFGELAGKENEHWFAAHLDLVGANGVGLFYLAMRKGLDYLERRPNVDRARLGVTGLSGGGWQTIVLSSLDERVAVAVPVAGYSALRSRLERPGDTGDVEQNPTDFLAGQDYTHLTAMRAPRPTLLIYNAEDDCCFRAPLVKPHIFDAIQPFFRLYGKESDFAWHENTDPSNHNYQLDNRLQSYRFFARHFGLPEVTEEIPVDREIRTVEELSAGLPEHNLTILGLARKLADGIGPGAGSREQLRTVLAYRPVQLRKAWAVDNRKSKGVESESYRFDFDNGMSATGVTVQSIEAPGPSRATIVLDDRGRQAAQNEVSERVNRGERVLAADLLLTGDMAPEKPGPFAYTQMLAATGDRPLGMEAAQLTGLAQWLHSGAVRVETNGIRSQMTALMAAALEPELFGEVVVRNGMESLRHLLDKPVEYQEAPDLFCLDLYRHFDVARLKELAGNGVSRLRQ